MSFLTSPTFLAPNLFTSRFTHWTLWNKKEKKLKLKCDQVSNGTEKLPLLKFEVSKLNSNVHWEKLSGRDLFISSFSQLSTSEWKFNFDFLSNIFFFWYEVLLRNQNHHHVLNLFDCKTFVSWRRLTAL